MPAYVGSNQTLNILTDLASQSLSQSQVQSRRLWLGGRGAQLTSGASHLGDLPRERAGASGNTAPCQGAGGRRLPAELVARRREGEGWCEGEHCAALLFCRETLPPPRGVSLGRAESCAVGGQSRQLQTEDSRATINTSRPTPDAEPSGSICPQRGRMLLVATLEKCAFLTP